MPEYLPEWLNHHAFRETLDGTIVDLYIASPENYTGIWKDWYASGKKFSVTEYVNGSPISGKTWHENGKVKYTMKWIKNELVILSYHDSDGANVIYD